MSAVNLSAAEAKLMAAVFSQMNDIPEVNYEEVGKLVRIKYARNARSSFKRLFEKVKANAAADDSGASGIGDDTDGTNATNGAKKTASAKKASSGKKTAATKAVGVTKKAAAPRSKAPRKFKKEIKEEVTENGGAGNSDMEDSGHEDGKFINRFTPINGKKRSRHDSVNTPMAISHASINGNEVGAVDDEEERDAQLRGMSVEDWRAWKLENHYDDYSSHAPTPTRCLSEEAA